VVNRPASPIPEVELLARLKAPATEAPEEFSLVDSFVLVLEKHFRYPPAHRGFVQLLLTPLGVKSGVNHCFTTAALHLPLKRTPAPMPRECREGQDSAASVALLAIGFRMLRRRSEEGLPESLGGYPLGGGCAFGPAPKRQVCFS